MQALENRNKFRVIDLATGWKVDFIITEDSDYGSTAFMRHMPIDIAGNAVYVASAEDVIIAKLQGAKMGGSDRQLQDAAGIVHTQGNNLECGVSRRVGCANFASRSNGMRCAETSP
jgi:hypothetical protein